MDQQKPSLLPLVAEIIQDMEGAIDKELKRKQRLSAKVSELSSRVKDFKYIQQLLN